MQLLATSPSAEPNYAPSDTAAIRAVSVWRVQYCLLDIFSNSPGRMEPMLYVAELDVPARRRFITVVLDPITLAGEIGVVHKGFDGSDTLVVPIEPPSTAWAGAPCGPTEID